MSGPRGLLIAVVVVALAIGSLWAPVAAVTRANLVIVSGIPGRVVDVCVDGNEVKSAIRYGAKAFRSLAPGVHALRFRARQPGICTGTTLAAKTLDLAPGDDLTIVATAHAPRKVVVFDNDGLGIVPGTTVYALAVRHAADLGGIAFKFIQGTPSPFSPSADAVWQKGDTYKNAGPLFVPHTVSVQTTFPDDNEPIAGPVALALRDLHRHEWILVGTNTDNARIVTIVRPFESL